MARPKKSIIRPCNYCNKLYQAEARYLNRGQGFYCSKECGWKSRSLQLTKPPKEPNVICAYCDKPFYKRESNQSVSKSGLFFCCREHKDLAQRIGGIKSIQPSHYGTTLASYRDNALRYYPNICKNCGYDKYPEILQVNHIDCDRSNNSLENLEILCPNCHGEYHFTTRTGFWSPKK